MKIFIKLMILALVLSYASLFILKKPDGTPIQTLDSLRPSVDLGNSSETVMGLFSSDSETAEPLPGIEMDVQINPQQIYRWQDESGSWHYGNSPPPGVQLETMDLDSPTVMTLYRPESEDKESEETDETVLALGENQSAGNQSSLIPERIREYQETIEQAQEVSNQLQERFDEQQRVLDSL